MRLRAATFNIRNGLGLDGGNAWPFRRATTARTIDALDADVVALQEVYAFQQRYLERRLSGYRFVGAGRTDGERGERCPILVHQDRATVVDVRTAWFGDTPDRPGTRLPGAGFPRIATVATIRLAPEGRTVQVTSTHLDEASAERRVASARQLLDLLDRALPQVVMGDLNADPGSEVVATLVDGGLTLVEPEGSAGTEHRFTGSTDGRRIDHVLVSDELAVVDATVVTTRLGRALPSDHWPVRVVLDL